MLRLKIVLERLGIRQKALAEALGWSRAAVAQWINHEQWPAGVDSAQLRERMAGLLQEWGAVGSERGEWWRTLPEQEARVRLGPGRGRGRSAPDRVVTTDESKTEDSIMLLRGQKLSEAARKHFALFRDPFRSEIREHADLFITPDARYCREAMWQTGLHGGMTAIVGESGSGKTTLREDFAERIRTSGEALIRVEPYVIDMEERGGRRLTLGARDIGAAIVHTLAPHQSVRASGQARFLQVHRLLAESAKVGNKHVLIIEEAHDLPTATLRHLKRYLELKEGFQPLLAVILLGQPELGFRLSELDASIREIVQRCEVVHLAPLDARLGDYLRHKFQRQGKALDGLLDDEAVEALRARLTVETGRGRGHGQPVSLVYPLAVQNLVTACLNAAADLGLERVTADVVREV